MRARRRSTGPSISRSGSPSAPAETEQFGGLLDLPHPGHEVPRLAKEAGGDPDVFLVMERDFLAEREVHLLCHRVISDSKVEFFGGRTGHDHHRELALPRLEE